MSNIVLQLNESAQKKIIDFYMNKKVDRNAPGVVFAAKLSDTVITAYKSGKVMFQGAGSEREAAKWGAVSTQTSAAKPSTKGDKLPNGFAQLSVIGSDETGTGDYFGPVTVAAVYVPKSKMELLTELGIKDSKMLTDEKMLEMAPLIKAACIHSVLVLRNEKYNSVQKRGWSQGKIKALLHNQALQHVLNKMGPEKPDYILIDQFAERGIYYNHLKNEKEIEIVRENVLFSTKAEQLHLSVAAASIIAREAFLKEMDKLSKTAGMTIPKGASKKVDEIAAKIWLSQGEETLKKLTKWHFANTEKARTLVLKK